MPNINMEDIAIAREALQRNQWEEYARQTYGDMVKIVVDTRRGILALGGQLHADAEQILIDDGSRQEDLWGANVFTGRPMGERIEYESLINVRPALGNRSTSIQDIAVQEKTRSIVDRLLL